VNEKGTEHRKVLRRGSGAEHDVLEEVDGEDGWDKVGDLAPEFNWVNDQCRKYRIPHEQVHHRGYTV